MTFKAPNGDHAVELTPQGDVAIAGELTSQVDFNDVPDYVFADDYKLTPLDTVETFVQKHKHLPDVPSAKELILRFKSC